jgi:hypothetical protein
MFCFPKETILGIQNVCGGLYIPQILPYGMGGFHPSFHGFHMEYFWLSPQLFFHSIVAMDSMDRSRWIPLDSTLPARGSIQRHSVDSMDYDHSSYELIKIVIALRIEHTAP